VGDFIFEHVERITKEEENKNTKYLIMVSYLEIYNEHVRDLLGRNPTASLEVRQAADLSFVVPELTRHVVLSNQVQCSKQWSKCNVPHAVNVT